MRQAVIETATGRILRIAVSPDPQEAGPGESVVVPVPEHVGDDTHRRVGDAWVAYPPRPQGVATFDFGAGVWVADEAATLLRRRTAMVLTDLQFAMAAALAGLITTDEAEAYVARGELPPVALGALDAISDPQLRALARIRFAGARTIARLDPFVDLLRSVAGLSEAQVDVLFEQGALL